MPRVLVDSDVLLDVFTEDPAWFRWSSDRLAEWADRAELAVNPVIYAEISIRFDRIEELEELLGGVFACLPISREAAFLAGKSFLRYRQHGGRKSAPLPDFFIGAHALVEGMMLLTRDKARYGTYFPKLKLVAP